jgi:putative metallohydrolase (TIGR04338 family)
MARPDPHAAALYAVERAALDDIGRRFVDVREARAFVEDVVGSDWFALRWPDQAAPSVERRGRGSAWSLAQRGADPDGAVLLADLDVATVLHELAHLCRGVEHGHDDRFVATLLALVRRWMGAPAYGALRAGIVAEARWPFVDDELARLT